MKYLTAFVFAIAAVQATQYEAKHEIAGYSVDASLSIKPKHGAPVQQVEEPKTHKEILPYDGCDDTEKDWDVPKQDELPKQEVPKQEIPKQEVPKHEIPKQEVPKQEEAPKATTPTKPMATPAPTTAVLDKFGTSDAIVITGGKLFVASLAALLLF